MCEKYLVLECEGIDDWGLRYARRLSDDEKPEFSEWCRDYIFVSLGEGIDLDYLRLEDCMDFIDSKNPDGHFLGCYNQSYIIDETQWKTLLSLNEKKKKASILKNIDDEIAGYKELVKNCERQGKLYTKEEAKKKERVYNNIYNEGGEGYVPHYYTFDEYELFKKRIAELQRSKDSMLKG